MLYSFFRRHSPVIRANRPEGPPFFPGRVFRPGFAGLAAFFGFVCCAFAQPSQDGAPLHKSAAWREGLIQLEKYKQGGAPPPPMRVGISLAPPFRPPAFTPGRSGSDWRNIVRLASLRHGVDEDLLTAVIQVESNFNPHAVSRAGALGLMQIMPETGKKLGLKDFFDPAANADAGARYLAAMLRLFPRLDLSLAAYNAGPAAVRQHGGRIPPYRETRDYVARVLSLYHRLVAQRGK
jgi:soluble lytic murein transglycosylase-like protein